MLLLVHGLSSWLLESEGKPEIRQEVAVDGTPQSEESTVDLGNTLFSHLFGGVSSKKFSRDALVEAQLVINLPKCELGKGQITYLGHEVGQGKVMPRQAKVRAILELPSPQTRRELMRVLGMFGFYRQFVPNFARIAEPLTRLLKKGVRYVWSDDCTKAYDQVKAVLACPPVL